MSVINKLPSDLTDRRFKIRGGKSFTVVKGEHFPEKDIGRQHQKYLSSLKVGLLVSVSFRGHPVPLVVVSDGVVRLVSIKMGRETLEGSAVISDALGVEETRSPFALSAE